MSKPEQPPVTLEAVMEYLEWLEKQVAEIRETVQAIYEGGR